MIKYCRHCGGKKENYTDFQGKPRIYSDYCDDGFHTAYKLDLGCME